MEKQVAKLKKQVKKLKETIKEMEYQRDKKALSEALSLDYYVVRREDTYRFGRFEVAIKESDYLQAIESLYGLSKVDELMKEGATFENIIRALDEVYLQGVELHTPALNEEELPLDDVELPF